jgi:hypothetical protein
MAFSSGSNELARAADKKDHLLIHILVLVAVNLGIFLPSLTGDFLWDDKYFISENANLLGPHFLKTLWTAPFGGPSGLDKKSSALDKKLQFFRPFTSLSYWLDFKIWGLNPAGFHLTNILLQTLNCLLLYVIILSCGWGAWPAFSIAGLFSVFPLHFESVSWISGRGDMLAFTFAALTVLFFFRFLKKGKLSALLISSTFYFGSLLAKESAAFLPLIFFLIMYRKQKKTRSVVVTATPFALAFGLWAVLRRVALGAAVPGITEDAFGNSVAALGFYAYKLILPFRLGVTIDSQRIFENSFFHLLGWLTISTMAVSVGVFLLQNKKRRFASGLLFLFGLLILPAILVVLSPATVSFMAWRFLYLPSVVPVLFLTYVTVSRIKRKSLLVAAIAGIAIVFAFEMYPKNRLFGRNETDFWLGLDNVRREDAVARINIGMAYLARDEGMALRIFNSVLAENRHPQYEMLKTRIYEELAKYYTQRGDLKVATKYIEKLLQMGASQSQNFYFIYANFLAQSGDVAKGERIVADLLQTFPENHLVLVHGAQFYVIVKNYPRALECLETDYRLFRNRSTLAQIGEVRKLMSR